MKRILFVAPYCFPINGPEAICNAKLLKELSRCGYIIDVISKRSYVTSVPESLDSSFSEKLNSLKIISVSNKINLRTIWEHFCVLLKTGYVYKGAHWAYYAINYAEKLLAENHYDWILSRSPSSELVALYLSRKYSIKWIANWNDPYPDEKYPFPYGKGANAKLPRMIQSLLLAVAKEAYFHTFPCKRLRNYMLRYMTGIDEKRTAIIPHICIENLFTLLKRFDRQELLMVHSGNVSYPRNPRTFLKGVRLFLDKVTNAKLRIFFIGKQNADFLSIIEEFRLKENVEIVKPLTYVENLKFVSRCDVAVLIEAACEEGIFLPTKVGDYMQCKKDIFAVSPLTGTLYDLYQDRAVKYFADCEDAVAICCQIEKMYGYLEEYKNGNMGNSIYYEYTSDSVIHKYLQLLG